MIELFLYANQIATYSSLSSSGNANGVRVALTGVQPLGGPDEVIRVVIRQVNSGQSAFQNGQFVDFYRWPSDTLIAQNLNPQHDQFQGRASSGSHQIFTNQRFVINLDGFSGSTLQFGPGSNPPRNESLTFGALMEDPPPPPCFVAGTQILTPDGWQSVCALRVGDLVETLDHGAQPILWRQHRTVSGKGPFAPIRLPAGLAGNEADLFLSPQHRVLLSHPRAEMLFSSPDVLIQSQHLQALPGVSRAPCDEVTYVHLLFAQHEILCAHGAAVESLHLGPYTVDRLLGPDRGQVETLLPADKGEGIGWHQAARRCLKSYEARAFLKSQDDERWPGYRDLAGDARSRVALDVVI